MAANCNDSLTTFNKQAVWEEQCVPALRRLVSLCSIYDIPLFVTACIRNDRSGSVPDQLGCVPEMEDMDEIFLD